jgi:hypothetical protein
MSWLLWYTYRVKKRASPPPKAVGFPNYGRTAIAGLKKSRRGKHNDVTGKIMDDLRRSEPGFAVTIPLASIGEVSVLNLRSAIVRAAAKEKINVATSSDDKSFYVWKA